MKYNAVQYEKIEKVINEWDPINMFPMAPMDEYSIEIKPILNEIHEDMDAEKISAIVNFVFMKYFTLEDGWVTKEKINEIGKKIHDILFKRND